MDESENQQMPDVSTEPQRQVLDEMSRQLVEKLNEMVHEQNERARRFAATQHSLSPLPGVPSPQPPVREVAEEIAPAATAPLPPTPEKKSLNRIIPFLPKGKGSRKVPQDFTDKPLAGAILGGLPPRKTKTATESTNKSEESGCGAVPTIIFIIILIIIFRSCS